MDPADITAIVLAGGAASRFGADKLAADLDGSPVLHHALLAAGSVAGEIVVVLAPGAAVPPLPDALAGRVRIARDAEPRGGPLAGVAAGLAVVRDRPARIAIVVGGDMPRLVPGVLRLLAKRIDATPGLVALTLEAIPPAPLPLALRPPGADAAVGACLAAGRRSLRSLLAAVPSATLDAAEWRAIDPSAETLRDIDTPEDLDRR